MKSLQQAVITPWLMLCLSSTLAFGAESSHEKHSSHNPMQHGEQTTSSADTSPTLSGQYAFETLSGIVSMLRADSDTQWENVNLDSLRVHLVDMHNVTIRAHVSSEPVKGGARFTVTSEHSDVITSIQSMISAHANVMSSDNHSGGYRFSYAAIDRGAQLTVLSDAPDQTLIIRGLGFHGILAEGDHHRQHHWMLATGQNPH